jgi:hypothetical protein
VRVICGCGACREIQPRAPSEGSGSNPVAGEEDGVRRALLGPASEADHALPLELQPAAADERYLSVRALHISTIHAQIDQNLSRRISMRA